jgi:hypothetical protein
MYPEVAIKASFPKTLSPSVEIANKVMSIFDKRIPLKPKP